MSYDRDDNALDIVDNLFFRHMTFALGQIFPSKKKPVRSFQSQLFQSRDAGRNKQTDTGP